jgi:phosphinothricin acetyltransferase
MHGDHARVRPAADGDLAAIAQIFAHYVTTSLVTFEETPPELPQWRERLADLADARLPFLVAEAGETVVGYAYASPWRPKPAYRYTVEDSVYLAPEWRGRGARGLRLYQRWAAAGGWPQARPLDRHLADAAPGPTRPGR